VILIFATPEEARELLGLSTRQPEIVRPQTSGPCVHYDEQTEHAADADPCTYPYGDEYSDGVCPHLDNPDVLCPVKDACYAMRDVARMRDAREAEQDEQDADMAAVAPSQTYETAAPEWVEPEPEETPAYTTPARPKGRAPAHVTEWTAEEDAAIRNATTAAEAVPLYRDAVPDSGRSDAAIRVQWYKKVRPGLAKTRDPLPDFVGDTAPVTQCDEDPVFTVPHSTYRPGDRVRIKHALHRGQTGEIRRFFPATENYLVAIDGMPDMIVLRDEEMEAA